MTKMGVQNMLNTIIACGQFNMCWNLLEYIEKIRRNPINTNEKHHLILDCEDQLLEDWRKFQTNPYWFVDLSNTEIGSSYIRPDL